MRRPTHSQGFTLMELMIGVSLVAILTAMAIPAYTSYRERGDRAQAKADLVDAVNAMERFKMQRFTYNGAKSGTASTNTIPSQSPTTGAPKYTIFFLTSAAAPVTTNPQATTFEILATSTRAMDGKSTKQEVLKVNSQGQRCYKKGAGTAATDCTYGTDESW